MRFSDGIWRAKEGVSIRSAVEVGKVQTTIDPASEFWHPFDISSNAPPTLDRSFAEGETAQIQALCHTKTVVNPGGTLGTPTIKLAMSSPMDGVIACEAWHFAGAPHNVPVRAELFPGLSIKDRSFDTPSKVTIDHESDKIVSASLSSANEVISARLDCRPSSFRVDFVGKDGNALTSIGSDSLQWILDSNSRSDAFETEYSVTTGSDPYHREPTSSRKGFMSVSLSVGVNEKVYGLGERFGPFIKNGQSIEVSNGDGGTSTYVGYKNIPFYITNRGYGVFYDHTEAVSVEVQADRMTKVSTTVQAERIRFNIIAGSSPKEILERYTFMTGRAPTPPDWSFGLWLSTSFLTKYDEETVMGIIERMDKEDIPLSVWHFDCFWSPAHEWCSFRWDPRNFPDPKGFLSRIHKKGIKVCVWINPYVAQESRLFEEGDKKGYFVKRTNGATFQCDDWQAGMAFVDLTNPKATAWWQSYLEELVVEGVDTFKTDFGEKLPVHDVVYHDGSDPKGMRNQYSFLYNKAVYDVIVRKKGVDESCVFARAGTIGSQRIPVHWGGDCDSEWTGMAESLRGGLSLALSGFAYWAHDIGGFKAEGAAGGYALVTPGADIYKRWVPFGLLSSHSRLHGSGSYRVPWIFGQEACTVLSKFTKLKHQLEPYILDLGLSDAAQSGIPLMRAMFLEFPQERTCWDLDMQYMFGDKLLVAPVFDPEQVEYYVPEAQGKWVNLLSGEEQSGGQWYTQQLDYLSLPLLLRPNTVLVMGRESHRFGRKIDDAGVLIVFGDLRERVQTKIKRRSLDDLIVTVAPEIGSNGSSFTIEVRGVSKGTSVEVLQIGAGIGLDTIAHAGARRMISTESQFVLHAA